LNPSHRKILYVVAWYLVYPQLWYLRLIPELFLDPGNRLPLSAVLILYVIGLADTYFRPFSESMREDMSTNRLYSLILLALFLLNPLLMILAYEENRLIVAPNLPFWDSVLVSYVGLMILMIGGLVTVTGRAQLARYGSGVLHIEEEHELVTTGVFRYIRHPVYAGGLAGIVGVLMAFRGTIVLLAVAVLYFVVLRHRLLFEEEMLLSEFGEEYRDYMKRTRRLIPLIY
jgi:protein-S-isoprenylcysteine O-methyltransferase Ste14